MISKLVLHASSVMILLLILILGTTSQLPFISLIPELLCQASWNGNHYIFMQFSCNMFQFNAMRPCQWLMTSPHSKSSSHVSSFIDFNEQTKLYKLSASSSILFWSKFIFKKESIYLWNSISRNWCVAMVDMEYSQFSQLFCIAFVSAYSRYVISKIIIWVAVNYVHYNKLLRFTI